MTEKHASWLFCACLAILTCLSVWVANNNDYMRYREVPVTYYGKFMTESCFKGFCRDIKTARYITDDGVRFTRFASDYVYDQMRFGERFSLTLRPIDIKQTTFNNIWWFFAPVILWCITGTLLLVFGGTFVYEWLKSKFSKSKE